MTAFGFHLTTGAAHDYYDQNLTSSAWLSTAERSDYGGYTAPDAANYGAHNFDVEWHILDFLSDYAGVKFV